LKHIQRSVGLTFIYVTHDQEEALTMSDRLAVFNRGQVEQVGSPAEVYEKRETACVAGFVGTSNILEGEAAVAVTGHPEAFTIRPEKIALGSPKAALAEDEYGAAGRVADVIYLGATTRYIVELENGGSLVVLQQNLNTEPMEELEVMGEHVGLRWKRQLGRTVERMEPIDTEEEGTG